MTERRYVDRSYKEPLSKSKTQNFLYFAKSDNSRKFLLGTAITLFLTAHAAAAYAATYWEMPETHPLHNLFKKKTP